MHTVFSVMLFFLPIAFLPFSLYNIESFKSFFFIVLTSIAFFSWIIFSLIRKNTFFVKNTAYLYYVAFVVIALVSSLVNGPAKNSILGTNFEIGTVLSVFSLGMAMLVAGQLYIKNASVIYITRLLALSAWIVGLYQILKVLLPRVFLSGTLPTLGFSLVGSVHSTAIFFGLIALLCVGILDNVPLEKRGKRFFLSTLLFSLLFVFVGGYVDVWIVFGTGVLLTFILSMNNRFKEKAINKSPHIPPYSIVTLTLTIIILLIGPLFIPNIANKVGFVEQEIRPSIAVTSQIYVDRVGQFDVVGPGPNNFVKVWREQRPTDIHNTVFAEVDFAQGFGTIPTLAINTGILGSLALLMFVLYVLYLFVKRMIQRKENENFLLMYVLPVSAFYLLYFSFFYTPSVTVLYLTGVMLGIFLVSDGTSNVAYNFSWIREKKTKLFSILVVSVFILGVVIVALTVKNFFANIFFYNAVQTYNQDADIAKTERKLVLAIKSSPSDMYYRSLSILYGKRLSDIYLGNTKLNEQEGAVAFQNTLVASENAARGAVAYDKNNSLNWTNLGLLYEPLISLKVTNAFDNAIAAYTEAVRLDPVSPTRELALARVYSLNGDSDNAREYIQKTLDISPNFAPAYYLLAQIEIDSNNTQVGEQYLERAVALGSKNFDIQVGYGQYMFDKKMYSQAQYAFEQAISINPTNLNARFFLALTYVRMNRIEDATNQLININTLSPNTLDVQKVLTDLQKESLPVQSDILPESSETIDLVEEAL